MPRGGARRGVPGRPYPERSDLRTAKLPVQTAPSTQYGSRVAAERAQQALPMGRPGTPTSLVAPPPAPQGGGAAPQGQLAPMPQPVSLTGPTTRPDEPLTSGIDMGAGPGSDVMPEPSDIVLSELRALYLAYPFEEIRAAIEEWEGQ